MIQYAYPRLDINVTKGLNHLLKSPFCIHPKTGKICTPFNPRTVEKFNPDTVPTINQLMAEVKLPLSLFCKVFWKEYRRLKYRFVMTF